MIDLHTHSHYSDGQLSPEALIELAKSNDVSTLALTDHDTVKGINLAREKARNCGISLVSGVEISVAWKKSELHILGLHIDENGQALQRALEVQAKKREKRAFEIAYLFDKLGISDTYKGVQALAGEGTVTRAHFAQYLVQQGIVKTFQAAFNYYLKRGRPCYVANNWMSLEDCVQVIHQAGGQAVIAHPARYQLTATRLALLLQTFKEIGGDGIEVISGVPTKAEIKQLSSLCQRYDLLASCGSDFHGDKGVVRRQLGVRVPMPSNCVPIWTCW